MSRRAGLLLGALLAAWPQAAAAAPPALPDPALDAARALLWGGDLGAAARAFAAILERRPADVDALLGAAQACRWSGRPLAALEPAQRALALAPGRRDVREEVAAAHADLERPRRARAVLAAGGLAPSGELAGRLARLERPALALATTAYDDSNGLVRLAPRGALALSLPGDGRLVLGGGATRVRGGGLTLDRAVASASLIVPWEQASLGASWVTYLGGGAPAHGAGLSAAYRASDALRLGLSARHRPFLEVAEPLATDEQAFYAAGVGGATDAGGLARRGVDELRLTVGTAPWRGAYLYLDAKALWVGDGNSGYTSSAGIGADLAALAAPGGPVGLLARLDTYLAGFDRATPDYYSPSSLVALSPGAELQLRLGSAVDLSGAAGPTFALGQSGAGWWAGAGVRLRLRLLTVAARAQERRDPWYHSRGAWIAIEAPL
jgi:hypothetical protein